MEIQHYSVLPQSVHAQLSGVTPAAQVESKPDVRYWTKGEIARHLLDGFDKFIDHAKFGEDRLTWYSLSDAASSSDIKYTALDKMVAGRVAFSSLFAEPHDVSGRQIFRDTLQRAIDADKTKSFNTASDAQLGTELWLRFGKFSDPNAKGFVTEQSLNAVLRGHFGATAEDSSLALEILQRPYYLNRLDVDGKGRLDGKIDQQNIKNLIASGVVESFSSWSDLTMLQQLRANFSPFIDPQDKQFITMDTLESVAKGGPGISALDSRFASELLRRPELLKNADADSNLKLDGKIDRENINNLIADLKRKFG